MKKITALMIVFLVMGFAFAAAQTTEDPKEPTKAGVKNAGVYKPQLKHRVQWLDTWVDANADGIQDASEVTKAAPKGNITSLDGTSARTWEPLKRVDYVAPTETATDVTTVSDIDLITEPTTTTTVDSTAVTLTKTAFRTGLSATGLTEGAGASKGAAAKALLRKGRG